MYKAYKYRLYPDKEQSVMFARTFGCCRKVWNLMLADKISIYEETGKVETVTPARYKKEYPYLKEVDSLALCNKQMDLEKAFRNYFKKSGRIRRGFPKFKSAKKTRKSYTTNLYGRDGMSRTSQGTSRQNACGHSVRRQIAPAAHAAVDEAGSSDPL